MKENQLTGLRFTSALGVHVQMLAGVCRVASVSDCGCPVPGTASSSSPTTAGEPRLEPVHPEGWQPVEGPCWSREQHEEDGAAEKSCHGLTTAPITIPLHHHGSDSAAALLPWPMELCPRVLLFGWPMFKTNSHRLLLHTVWNMQRIGVDHNPRLYREASATQQGQLCMVWQPLLSLMQCSKGQVARFRSRGITRRSALLYMKA